MCASADADGATQQFRPHAAGEFICLDIEADGFLYNMVRAITGTLLEVGRGRRTPEEMIRILEARSCKQAGENAPARGLCLVQVHYPGEVLA